MTAVGVRRDKAALSSGCKPHPAIRSSRKQPEGIVNLAARGLLVVAAARRLGSEGPLLAYRAAPLNGAGPQKGALGPLS